MGAGLFSKQKGRKAMRTGKVTIGGVEYPITYTLGTQMALEEEGYSDPSTLITENPNKTVTNFVHLLALMISAGCKYEKRLGKTAPEPITEDRIAAMTGTDEIGDLMTEVSMVIRGERRVEAEAAPAPKKRRPTPARK